MRIIDSLAELKSIQLDMLLNFHQFCVNNHINYSLAYGSLIGAIRHKGFIPWDDDIDIFILREDYELLVKLFPTAYNQNYEFVSMERDCKWHRAYGVMYDNRTLKMESTSDPYNRMGVSMDIFPIDDVPDKYSDWVRYNKLRKFLSDVITMKHLVTSKRRSMWKNILIIFSKIVLYPFTYSFLARIMNKYSQIHNGKGYSHVYENCLGVYNSEYPWLKESFNNVIDAEFEGHYVKIIKGYDDLLISVYGDYMQLPPIEKRIAHHAFDAYWKE